LDLAVKIVELLDDPLRRAEMGKYGRRRVENELAWNHEAPKLLAAYEVLWSGAALSPAERSVET
jgi:glycosyltransferase involved in cell wall biosynthesis